MEKLNELARNDCDVDEETDFDDSFKESNSTDDEFVHQRMLPDLVSNQLSKTHLDQSSSNEVSHLLLDHRLRTLFFFSFQYRQAIGHLFERTTSILAASMPMSPSQSADQQQQQQMKRASQVDVNVSPHGHFVDNADLKSCAPEIRKYKKRFNSDILCAALWGS